MDVSSLVLTAFGVQHMCTFQKKEFRDLFERRAQKSELQIAMDGLWKNNENFPFYVNVLSI
jgi:hypothetical protein